MAGQRRPIRTRDPERTSPPRAVKHDAGVVRYVLIVATVVALAVLAVTASDDSAAVGIAAVATIISTAMGVAATYIRRRR